jgi:3-oxoacyl-ACP reductase-like protein
MLDRQGFSDKDIEALRKPNNRQACRTSPRTPAESALPASVHAANDAAPAPIPDMQASAAGDGGADLIQEASDKATATFSSKRKLLLDLITTWAKTHSTSTHGKCNAWTPSCMMGACM